MIKKLKNAHPATGNNSIIDSYTNIMELAYK